jgi:hypothetical protein
MSPREAPTSNDARGLRRARAIVERLLETRCEEAPRAWSWEEGWKLGIEEVAYGPQRAAQRRSQRHT